MKYRNTVTGDIIETYGIVGGGNWEEVKETEQETGKETKKKTKKKPKEEK